MCHFESEWGRCKQPTDRDLCYYHARVVDEPGFKIDRYYHRKVVLGLVDLTDNYIDRSQMQALFGGRPRGDGRELDEWTI